MKRLLGFFLLSIFAGSALADDTNSDQQIAMLLPISIGSHQIHEGAYGTRWTGELWVHNASTFGFVHLQHWPNVPNCAPLGCRVTIPAGFLGAAPTPSSNGGDGGALLYIPAEAEQQIHISARLLELSRRAQPIGVDIPVIHEDDFFTQATTYLAVPVAEGIRSTFRVYDPRLKRGSAVQVEFLSPEGTVVASTVLRPGDDRIVPAPGSPYIAGRHSYPYPGMAKINSVTETFPELLQHDRYHVRVTPLTPGMEYWAMVSVTDNESQHVLLITAQP